MVDRHIVKQIGGLRYLDLGIHGVQGSKITCNKWMSHSDAYRARGAQFSDYAQSYLLSCFPDHIPELPTYGQQQDNSLDHDQIEL